MLDFTKNFSNETLGKAQVLKLYIHGYKNVTMVFWCFVLFIYLLGEEGNVETGAKRSRIQMIKYHNSQSAFPRP